MKEITLYVCEECNKEFYIKEDAIHCEKEHKKDKYIESEDYDKRVVPIANDMYYFKANSSEDLAQCIDIYFEDFLWYSKETYNNYKYPCDLLLTTTANIYTEENIVIINELSKILEKIGEVLNKKE